MRLYAQLDNSGTAMVETTLCAACVEIAAFRAAHSRTYDDNAPTAGVRLNNTDRHDVTGNRLVQEHGCNSCGWPSRIEWAEFMRRMLDAFPFGTVDEDNEGQLVIYTGLTQETARQPDGSHLFHNAILMED